MFTEPVSPQTNQSETSTQKLRANTLSSSQNEIDLRIGDDEVMTGSSTQLAPPPVSSRPRPVPPKSLGPGIRVPHHHPTPRTSSSPHPKDVIITPPQGRQTQKQTHLAYPHACYSCTHSFHHVFILGCEYWFLYFITLLCFGECELLGNTF